jgi:hypothetical protein
MGFGTKATLAALVHIGFFATAVTVLAKATARWYDSSYARIP